jgi:uncharacterized protein (DUF4415 family)
MENEKHLKRYTAEQLQAMQARGESLTNWQKVDATQNAQDDEDERGLVVDWTSAQLVIPKAKKHINLRVDDDVVDFFKKTGNGYQTRMNAVLRSYMLAQERPYNH